MSRLSSLDGLDGAVLTLMDFLSILPASFIGYKSQPALKGTQLASSGSSEVDFLSTQSIPEASSFSNGEPKVKSFFGQLTRSQEIFEGK